MKIITISRQYGAGGREIGLAVGKELGVTLYDRDIIAATAKASSIDASQIEREGEEISATESILRNITPISYDQKDYIYETQRSVILDLAKQGPCVILGRCADVVLHDAGIETLNVYIYSDEAHRAERISGYLNTTDTAEIVRAMKKKDRALFAAATMSTTPASTGATATTTTLRSTAALSAWKRACSLSARR